MTSCCSVAPSSTRRRRSGSISSTSKSRWYCLGCSPSGHAGPDQAAPFGLDLVPLEVEVVLLGVFAVGPARWAVVLHPLEGQIDLAQGDAGKVVVTALPDGAACHLRVEGRQLHRVRAVDDETQELQHQAILPQSRA